MDHDGAIRAFFDAYAARLDAAMQEPPEIDVDGTVAAYADCVVEAHPGGVMCFQNDAQFRERLPQMYESQRRLGAIAMQLADLQITPLDSYHTMAKIRWHTIYHTPDGDTTTLAFDEIYFVQTRDGAIRVFARITGDQEGLLKQHGVIRT